MAIYSESSSLKCYETNTMWHSQNLSLIHGSQVPNAAYPSLCSSTLQQRPATLAFFSWLYELNVTFRSSLQIDGQQPRNGWRRNLEWNKLYLQEILSGYKMIGLVARQDGFCTEWSKRAEPDDIIPVIDFQLLNQEPCITRSAVIKDVARACEEIGCFRVVNHGISKSLTEGALQAASAFFELPTEAKAEFASDDLRKPVRYEAAIEGSFGKSRALLKHYAHPLKDWIDLWPHKPREYRERMGKYTWEVRRVALQLIDAILESLGLGRAYLRDRLEDGMQLVAVNCYPQHTQQELKVGLAPHSDYAFITILLQSSDGLQIIDGDGESWRPVPLLPESLHIHIGDHLEVLSNGRYKSLLHRAVQASERRISIASIHGLSMYEKVAPAKELLDEQHQTKYRESSFKDFLDFISTNIDTGRRSFVESLKISGV